MQSQAQWTPRRRKHIEKHSNQIAGKHNTEEILKEATRKIKKQTQDP